MEKTADQEVYQLVRGGSEISRLNSQNDWSRSLARGLLLHPSIPPREISTIADVATGTGIWMASLASHRRESEQHGRTCTFVGFDVSDAQFPTTKHQREEEEDELPDFVVHDMTSPFPSKYHQAFDLVHIRLVVAALRTKDLQKVVQNVAEILSEFQFKPSYNAGDKSHDLRENCRYSPRALIRKVNHATVRLSL